MGQALLIIDMQQGLFGESDEPFEAEQVVDRINDLASRARAGGVPVVWVQHERPGTCVEYASEGWRLLADLVTTPDDLFVRKTTPDAFLSTGLEDLLVVHGVDHVVVCGFATEFCVDTTVRRAAALGYGVTLASDAHTTSDRPHATAMWIRAHHNATLPEIVSFGPRIAAVPSADIGFEPVVVPASVAPADIGLLEDA